MRIHARLAAALAAGAALTTLAAPSAFAAPVDTAPVDSSAPDVDPAGTSPSAPGSEGAESFPDPSQTGGVDFSKLSKMERLSFTSPAELEYRLRDGLITREEFDEAMRLMEQREDANRPPEESAPYHCTVDGKPVALQDGKVEGTQRDETIRCFGTEGVRVIDGGAGRDKIILESGMKGVTVLGGDGNDEITVQGTLSGHPGAESVISGGEGDDRITIEKMDGKNIQISGDQGDDTLVVKGANTGRLDGGDGADSLYVHTNEGEVLGGSGNDRIEGYTDTRAEEAKGWMAVGAGSRAEGGDGYDICLFLGAESVPSCENNIWTGSNKVQRKPVNYSDYELMLGYQKRR
ncbi:hypothetical protein [Streptomyces sp. NPDC057682]|uniref:hypothetical protein n=1 Tax=Streptomyces sp. NPDC057682 TaxID=3346210 RepID=UPI0036A577E5